MRRILLAMTALASGLAWGSVARAADQPITLCTGVLNGNYEFVGTSLVKQLGQSHITLVTTAGSVDNLEKVSGGACQAGLAQADAWFLFNDAHPREATSLELARTLYPEYGHLICNERIKELSDLKRGDTVLVGPKGSGSAVMWAAIVAANKAYAVVGTLPVTGTSRPLGKVADGTDAACMLFVAGLNSTAMKEANDFARTAQTLHLTYMRDPKLFELKDAKGRAIYTRTSIPYGTYSGGLQKSGFLSSGSAVDTVQVQSVLFANVAYIDANPTAYEEFLTAVKAAMPAINERVLAK